MSRKTKTDRAREERASALERAAADDDLNAMQHLTWAKSYARDGDTGRAASETKAASELTANADRLRREAEQLRQRR